MRKQIIAGLCVLLSAGIVSGYLHFENTALQTTAYAVTSEKLPRAFDGYKIAQISDFHNAQSASLNRRLREAVRQAKPDIIVLTGDLIDRRRTDVETAIRLVHDLREVAPIYFVSGNHDILYATYDTLSQQLRAEGVRMLENEKTVLHSGTDTLCLAGIDDPTKAREGIDNAMILQTELEHLSLDAQQFTVLLSHRPEALDVYASQGVDLVFAGHAHGGQIRLPFIGGLFAPNQGVLPQYTAGVYLKDRTQMVVSRGIGNSAFPFRVQNRPELVVATLGKE